MEVFLAILAILTGGLALIIAYKRANLNNTNNDELISKIKYLEEENKKLLEEKGYLNAQLETAKHWEEKITNTVKNVSQESNQSLLDQLLKTHHLQAEESRKQTHEELHKAFTEKESDFLNNVQQLTSTVDILKSDVKKNQKISETLKNAFSSSAHIGQATETVLENTLNSFGFTKGRDFFTQFSVESLRADAIVILPDDNALVIDAKASKFIYELAEAEQTQDETQITQAKNNLQSSMNNHLKTLSSKNYADAVQKELNNKQHTSILRENIPTIMFLPNESAIEKVIDADPNFLSKASTKDVFVCGPTGLWVAIGIAKQKVELHKKVKNYKDIASFTASVLKNVQKIFKETQEVQRGLKIATKGYEGTVKTLNTNIPQRVREMESLGIPEHANIQELDHIEDTPLNSLPSNSSSES